MKSSKGITLIELVVSIAILSLILSIIVPRIGLLDEIKSKYSLKTQTNELLLILLSEKNKAITDGCKRKIYIFKDKIYIQKIGDTNITNRIDLKDGIRVSSNTYYGGWLEFKPIGTVNRGGHITLSNSYGLKKTIVIQIGSGRVYQKEGSNNE